MGYERRLAFAALVVVGLSVPPSSARAEDDRAPRLEAVYAGPTVAPLLGVGGVIGVQWRVSSWLSGGGEFDFLDQAPLRYSLSLRATAVAHYTFEFGGYGALRFGTGYRHVRLHGQTYRVRAGRAEPSTHAGFPLWSNSAEIAIGYDASRALGWPVRLSVAPGVQASFPQLEGFGVDLYVTTRLAWKF